MSTLILSPATLAAQRHWHLLIDKVWELADDSNTWLECESTNRAALVAYHYYNELILADEFVATGYRREELCFNCEMLAVDCCCEKGFIIRACVDS